MVVKSPVAEVSVMPDASALVWPQMCCCCGSTTALYSIAIYAKVRLGGASETIYIPYCRRCMSHYRRAWQRAGESAVTVFAIGFTLLFVLFIFGLLTNPLVAFFLQVLVIVGCVVWGVRAYFVARAEIKNGITPACSCAETHAVFFVSAQPRHWRFRFYSRAYAEQFAAANLGGAITELLL
jgi:hypothetical protein